MTAEKNLFRTFLLLAVFSIAMGYMESAIVVYLRKIYYPGGFKFPLTPIDVNTGIIEILREAATLIMLVSVGIIAGKTKLQRFSFFIFCFGTWDIFYYVFLKIMLGWPLHLFDWDILFLIPVPWVGPVIAPCILSLTMIVFAIVFTNTERHLKLKASDWVMFSSGSAIIIFSFIYDYIRLVFSEIKSVNNQAILSEMNNYIPGNFQWWIFCMGESILLITVLFILRRSYMSTANTNQYELTNIS